MPQPWTMETILALVPDERARKNALSLALPQRWTGLSRQVARVDAIWGMVQGSSTEPYRVQVDLDGPGYGCSCPSKYHPCKHALALLLLFAAHPEDFQPAEPPEWLAEWMTRRARKASPPAGPKQAPDLEQRARESAERAARREANICAGLEDLERWLFDLVNQGFAAAREHPSSFWEDAAARQVDAQAPGFARLVRRMAAAAQAGSGWQDQLLETAARLHMAIEGYRRLAEQPADMQADLRVLAGWNQKQDHLRDQPGIRDTWLVLGRTREEETGLIAQRTWLWGCASQRHALELSFTPVGGTPVNSLPVGKALPAELVFYPGAYPLRAVARSQQPAQPLPSSMPGCATLSEAFAGYAAALARNPWLERFPMCLNRVVPQEHAGAWALIDDDHRRLPIARFFANGWTLLAFSGGAPVGVFGEWNGETFLPLSIWANGSFYAFAPVLETTERL